MSLTVYQPTVNTLITKQEVNDLYYSKYYINTHLSFTGAFGPTGAIGSIGPTGPIGSVYVISGSSGFFINGPTGAQGSIGPTGTKGDIGLEGPVGLQGPTGVQGIQGVIGPQGIQGPIGLIGPTGAIGSIGPQGPIGETYITTGPTGAILINGPTGPRGLQGDVGSQGPQGVIGPVGSLGPTGPQGIIGPVGPRGNQGNIGMQGPTGPLGLQITVNDTMSITDINSIISNTGYNFIYFTKGTYVFPSAILVTRNNIILDGGNSSFTITSNVNQPNICIGDVSTNPATITTANVSVRNFRFDGNRSQQTSEFWPTKPWVPASCVVGVKAFHFYLTECNLDSARSGGMTLIDCNDVVVDKCTSTLNYFDAYTFYGTLNLKIVNCNAFMHLNGAGISADNGNNWIIIANCTFNNNKESIFARDTNNTVVSGCTMNNNLQQGVFLSGYGVVGNDRGCEKWTLNNNSISNNGAQGLWFQSCKNFSITGNVINNNGGIGVEFGNDTIGAYDGSCSFNSLSSNVICNNIGNGVYNNPNNSYSAGARDNLFSMNVVKGNAVNFSGDYTSVTVEDELQLNTNSLTIKNTSGNYCNITSSSTGNSTIVLPSSNGSTNQCLATNGSGNTFWLDVLPNTVYATDNTLSVTNTATTWTNTGFYVTINRVNPSARVKINFNGQLGYRGSYFGVFSISRLYRTITTELTGNTYGLALIQINNDFQTSFEWIDTLPSVGTDTIVYQIVTKCITSGSCIFNNSGVMQTMSAAELQN